MSTPTIHYSPEEAARRAEVARQMHESAEGRSPAQQPFFEGLTVGYVLGLRSTILAVLYIVNHA